jgi:hypothetical protein
VLSVFEHCASVSFVLSVKSQMGASLPAMGVSSSLDGV